jgi:hypothetical protein
VCLLKNRYVSMSTCATGFVRADYVVTLGLRLHWQSQWHTFQRAVMCEFRILTCTTEEKQSTRLRGKSSIRFRDCVDRNSDADVFRLTSNLSAIVHSVAASAVDDQAGALECRLILS